MPPILIFALLRYIVNTSLLAIFYFHRECTFLGKLFENKLYTTTNVKNKKQNKKHIKMI